MDTRGTEPTASPVESSLVGGESGADFSAGSDAERDSLAEIFEDASLEEFPPQPRGPWLGISALAMVAIVAIFDGVAMMAAYSSDYDTAIALAIAAISIATLAVLAGLAAVITGRGRVWGALSIGLGILINPYVLAGTLGMLASMTRG